MVLFMLGATSCIWTLYVAFVVLSAEEDVQEGAMLDSAASSSLKGSEDSSSNENGFAQDQDLLFKHQEEQRPEQLEDFLTHQTSFPVVVLCHNRANMLKQTLESLFNVRGVKRSDVLVVQDGQSDEVENVIQNLGVSFYQRSGSEIDQKEFAEPARRITAHYNFSLHKAMTYFRNAPGIVVVEDDFLFSPDFMEFFVKVAPVVDEDPSVWLASAWNDNGFKGLVKDPLALRRTDFFPGLGWLLLRSVWDEIKSKWPQTQWDWFMRDPKISKDRDIIYPEVPRDFHAGKSGTNVDQGTQMRYFDRIDYNRDPSLSWKDVDLDSIGLEAYEERIESLINSGLHVEDIGDLFDRQDDRARIIWYEADPYPQKEIFAKPMTQAFHIWHQIMRGARNGLHEFWFKNAKVLLINTFKPGPDNCREKTDSICEWFHGYKSQSKYVRLKPKDARIFSPTELAQEMKTHKNFQNLRKLERLKKEEEEPLSLDRYKERNGAFPVVLMCYNRANKLEETLNSLLAVRGVKEEMVLVVQDGSQQPVTAVIQRMKVHHISRPEAQVDEVDKKDPGRRIASHYKYSLSSAFKHFPQAPAVIVVEDDFLFSPDFMEYFVTVAPVVLKDPTVWLASAWNDNGFRGVAQQKDMLLRTDHFPGLGWLLLRTLWEELEPKWPRSQWDWFMRDPRTSKGREVIFPEVPRDYHTGSRGSFMEPKTHKMYFESIGHNRDSEFSWTPELANQAFLKSYEARIESMLSECNHLEHGQQLSESALAKTHENACFIIWYNASPHPMKESFVKAMCKKFHIWHQIQRGAHAGTHFLWFRNRRVLLINVYSPPNPNPCFMPREEMEKKLRERDREICEWWHDYPSQTKFAKFQPHGARTYKPLELAKEIS